MGRPKNFEHRFKPEGKEALSRRQVQVKVPVAIAEAIDELHGADRGAWLRKVITEAIEKELMKRA